MKRKPWSIIFLALLHVLAPLGNIIMNSFRSGRTLENTWNFWLYTLPKPLFFAYVVLPPIAGFFIYICRRWSYWSYVACLGFIFLANVYGFWTSVNWMNFVTLLVVLLADVLAVAYFVVPSVRQIYFDPRMRWWETAPRYVFNIHGFMGSHSGFVKNISEGGAFVESQSSYPEGSVVEVTWSFEGESFVVPGKVVYQRKQGPSVFGYGVRFDHTPQTQKGMRLLITRLEKEGKLIRDRLPGPEDSFAVWLKKLIVNREGLFPKA
jgi:hypothetical protein